MGVFFIPTGEEELRLKTPRPVATPEGPTSCWSEPIERAAVDLPPNFFTFVEFLGGSITAR